MGLVNRAANQVWLAWRGAASAGLRGTDYPGMSCARWGSARSETLGRPDRGSATIRGAFGLLVLLSVWSVAYELGDSVLPALGRTLPFQGVAHDIAFALAAALLVVRGVRGDRAWALIGVGAFCWAAGDVYWSLALANLSSPPVPSWADAGYLSFCPLWLAGILSLVRQRRGGVPRTLIADALAAGVAVGAVSAAVVVQPVLASARGGMLAIATNVAYPVNDLLLLGLIVSAIALGNWRLNRTWVLLGASVVAFWIADSLYLITVASNTYQQTAWFNPLWYWSPVLAAWAAWLPQPSTATGRVRTAGTRGIVMPLLFALGALAILVWSSFHSVGIPGIVLATSSLLVIMVRLALTWRENARLLRLTRAETITDPLTGLGNRRALTADLERRLASADPDRPFTLVLFDLDGFKHYNDDFGHPAGDALLQRLGHRLLDRIAGRGIAYRMGGDEFCALIDAPDDAIDAAIARAADALSDQGEGFTVTCSYGSVRLPTEAQDPENALRTADQRMYSQKRRGRPSASQQSTDVLLQALAERSPELGAHQHDVAALAAQTAAAFALPAEETERIRRAAELHDIGKVAIPDAILNKPGALDHHEWVFIRRHTLIGERIIAAAPDLRQIAKLVRSSHENYNGTGYPDALSGQAIPLGSRIIAVCDAYDAMTTDRPYRAALGAPAALAELHRCAGTQFDPAVVQRFCEVLQTRHALGRRAA